MEKIADFTICTSSLAHPRAAHPDGIRRADACRVALDDAEGMHVLRDAREASDVREASHRREVMACAGAVEDRAIPHPDVPGEENVIREHDAVADRAVVGNVAPDHEQVVGADRSDSPALRSAGMDGDVLAEAVAVPDDQLRELTAELQVLRRSTDDGAGIEDVAFPDDRVTHDRDLRVEQAVRTEPHGALDDAVRTDAHALVELGAFVDHGGGMDVRSCGRRLRQGKVESRLGDRGGRPLSNGNARAHGRP